APVFVRHFFYKWSVFPAGVGGFRAGHGALPLLRRRGFRGGPVIFASVRGRAHTLARREAGFEDGTLNYISIPAVDVGLQHLERVGIDAVHRHVCELTSQLLARLLELRHSNGHHLVRIYGPTTMDRRGATITMNFYDPEAHLVAYGRVEELANAQRISLRTGCFCNPGAGEAAEGLTEADMREAATLSDMTLPHFVQFMQHRGGKSAGAIRVSLGIAS